MYQLLGFLHLLAAITWIGGSLFLFLVLVPVTRKGEVPASVTAVLVRLVGRRFRTVAWLALAVLVATGIWMVLERGIGPGDLFTGGGGFITALRVKLGLVAVVLVLSAVHDFVLGPRVGQAMEALRGASSGAPEVARQRRLLSWLARVNVALALVIVALGVVLVRGWPF